jgi:transcriptional regulator GlxA family with amidase domain
VKYITRNLPGDLSVSALAKRFSLEESVLLPAFELHTGKALDQYVLRRRIERALDLLKHSNATDGEIAMGIGWVAASAFQAAFASYLGVSPMEYRSGLPRKLPARSSKRPCKSVRVPLRESGSWALATQQYSSREKNSKTDQALK